MNTNHANNRGEDRNDILTRYLNGTCTEKERALVEQWYNLKASEESGLPDSIDFKKLKQEMWKNIDKPEGVMRQLKYKLAGIAAAVILLFALSITLLNHGVFNGNKPEAWVKIKASEGKVIKVDLPDGSKVWLNAGSTLAYLPSFGKDNRTVQLTDGEAYFDVAHNELKPFVVLTGNLKTQVLGTLFNIRAATEMKRITVTVLRGKVAVSKTGAAPLFLLPDQQAEFNKETGRIDKTNVTAANMTGWIAGKFRFHNEELEVITSELQRRYNVTVIFKTDELRSIRFNAGFNADDRLSDVLNDLAKTGNIKYKIHANQVTISPATK
ncbi:MAG: Ferric-dicitrate binding protein FerR, regulates iron transport through sigma9 [Bacteroidota bacterium]|nr:Ferric-dicitrate binding protein FerR, regulates iron transport through sigma9 [Bacteroidota bacterium]